MKHSLKLCLLGLLSVCFGCNDDDSANSGVKCEAGLVKCAKGCVDLSEMHWKYCNVCESGYRNRDKDSSNGCEWKLDDNAPVEEELDCGTQTNCGDYCVDLSELNWAFCDVCAAGYEDKDGESGNGCEAEISHESGGGAEECSGTNKAECDGICLELSGLHWSDCGICVSGYEDIDGNAANGCEAETCKGNTTRCGNKCLNLEQLHLQSCNTCEAGYANYDGSWSTGCEEAKTVYECPAGMVSCGQCVNLADKHWTSCYTCTKGYEDLDGLSGNGCETPVSVGDCPEGQVKCNGTCISLVEKHLADCETCIEGYADKDKSAENGCEAADCSANMKLCGDKCSDFDEKNWSACGTCKAGFVDGDGDSENGCEVSSSDSESCLQNEDCLDLAHVNSATCTSGICVIQSCATGYADCDGKTSTGCEVNGINDYYHCGASGKCKSASESGKQCALGEQCSQGKCSPIPEIIGCSDGTREGFLDLLRFNNLAACGGAWKVPGIHHNTPSCDRKSGNTGVNREGDGCNLEDLCAEGWHVCLGRGDVMTRSDYGCDGIMDGVENEPALFITRTSSTGQLKCDPDTVGLPLNMNDIFGCGNFGCKATGSACDPLTLSGHNLCSALTSTCSCKKDSNGTITCNQSSSGNACYGGGIGHSIDYFRLLNGKNYQPAWSCNGDSTKEATNIVKSKPDEQGGVMCCKDQCQEDEDCGAGLICRYHVCVECIKIDSTHYEGCPAGKTCSDQHTCV